MAIIEVETVESVNNLEALAEWVPFGRLKPEFHLYVPAAMVDVARRMCTDSNIPVAEIHSYHWIGDEMRFLPVYKAPSDGRAAAAKPAPKPRSPKRAAAKSVKKKPVKAAARKPVRKTANRLNANSFAISAVHPRQARVRNNLPRACRSPRRPVTRADSVLVPHAAGRARWDVPRSTKMLSAG